MISCHLGGQLVSKYKEFRDEVREQLKKEEEKKKKKDRRSTKKVAEQNQQRRVGQRGKNQQKQNDEDDALLEVESQKVGQLLRQEADNVFGRKTLKEFDDELTVASKMGQPHTDVRGLIRTLDLQALFIHHIAGMTQRQIEDEYKNIDQDLMNQLMSWKPSTK